MDSNYMRNSKRVREEANKEGGMAFDGRPYDMVDWEYEASLPKWMQYWRAKWNLKPRGPMWLPQIIRMTWYLTVINFVLGIHGQIDGDLGGPFFYSRTSCCGQSGTAAELPVIYDVHYPKTMINYHVNVSYLRACDVPELDPEDPYWSHTAYCPNWDYVRAFTQKLGAGRSMTLTMMSLFCMPIGAGFADKQGRKPMFIFGFLLGVKSLALNLVSSTAWSIHTDTNAYILYVSGILSGMGSGCGPVSMAMMVDLIPGDMREQGFPMMNLFGIPVRFSHFCHLFLTSPLTFLTFSLTLLTVDSHLAYSGRHRGLRHRLLPAPQAPHPLHDLLVHLALDRLHLPGVPGKFTTFRRSIDPPHAIWQLLGMYGSFPDRLLVVTGHAAARDDAGLAKEAAGPLGFLPGHLLLAGRKDHLQVPAADRDLLVHLPVVILWPRHG